MAAQARAGRLVLSHNMARSLRHLDAHLELIRRSYAGPVSVAEDLDCFPLE
jgi:ribonuclease BN (tRNA processing enzyme)